MIVALPTHHLILCHPLPSNELLGTHPPSVPPSLPPYLQSTQILAMVIESMPSATKIKQKGAEGTLLEHKHERIDVTAQLEPNEPSILLEPAELEHEEREGAEIESMPSANKIECKGAEGTQLKPEHHDRVDATAELEPNAHEVKNPHFCEDDDENKRPSHPIVIVLPQF